MMAAQEILLITLAQKHTEKSMALVLTYIEDLK